MININVNNILWKYYSDKKIRLWIKGYIYSHTIQSILGICNDINQAQIELFLKSLDGHFGIIVQTESFTFMATDKIRSAPLFFIKIKNNFFIDSDPKNLVNFDEFDKTINEDAKLEISMSGYTIGNKTLYKKLHSLKAGELVIFQDNSHKYFQYYKYFGEIVNKSFDEYLEELSEVTIKIFQKMQKNIGNRQIVVPLSAGNDSRLVVSVLKYLGAKNVKCYSYGTPGNFESDIARIIAKKLGYDWKFIPLIHKSEKNFYASKSYKKYLAYGETYSSVPYIQSLSTIKYLKGLDWIDQDAIFVNGNTGDFISGGHINPEARFVYNDQSILLRKDNILNQLVEKHFSLWGYLKTKDNLSKIKNNLWNEIAKGCHECSELSNNHQFYEYSEFIDRQSKYVISGQRAYEYYGYEWRLPLWDDEYLLFWQKVPLNFKLKQKLYKGMLKKKNFGDVWSDEIPVNKKMITPKWIIPLRFICKIPFSFFGKKGKKAWKQFDINFFYYFMDITHIMDAVNYARVIKDIFKKPRNIVSWTSEDYLSKF
jgi:asparagine synthase (glutamine-hydrolysing)